MALYYLHNKTDYYAAFIHARTSQMVAASLVGLEKSKLKMDMITSGIISIKTFSNFPDAKKECDSVLDTILETMEQTQDINLAEEDVDELILMISEIKERNKIP